MSDYFSMAACLPKTEHYCYAESVVGKTWRSCAWEQCEHCKKYQEMKVPAHFPVPATYTGVDVFLVDYSMLLIKEFFEEEWK